MITKLLGLGGGIKEPVEAVGSVLDSLFTSKEEELNLEIVKSDLENNLLYLKGSIPGSKNSTVILRGSVKVVTRKTIKEKHEAKIKEVAAKKGKK